MSLQQYYELQEAQFGCLSFPWLRPYRSHKLEARSNPCVFLSPKAHSSVSKKNRLYVSRHVQFVEHSFPFHSLSHNTFLLQLPNAPISLLPARLFIESLPSSPRTDLSPPSSPTTAPHSEAPSSSTDQSSSSSSQSDHRTRQAAWATSQAQPSSTQPTTTHETHRASWATSSGPISVSFTNRKNYDTDTTRHHRSASSSIAIRTSTTKHRQ